MSTEHAKAAIDAPEPRKFDGRHKRGRLRQLAFVDAARELFVTVGYRGATLEAIIARAGGSRETIYRMFGGKAGLFRAIIAASGAEFAASIIEPIALTLRPREGLMRIGLQLSEVWHSQEGRAINHVVVSEGLDAPELVEAWYKGAVVVSIDALSQYLDGQVSGGHLAMLDSQLVARQFVTLLMGELAFPRISSTAAPNSHDVQVTRCVDLILKAYQRVA